MSLGLREATAVGLGSGWRGEGRGLMANRLWRREIRVPLSEAVILGTEFCDDPKSLFRPPGGRPAKPPRSLRNPGQIVGFRGIQISLGQRNAPAERSRMPLLRHSEPRLIPPLDLPKRKRVA